MSAFLVGKAHIDFLVAGATSATRRIGPLYYNGSRYPNDTSIEPPTDTIGRMLWRENLASLKARYPEDADGHRPGPNGLTEAEIDAYHARPLLNRLAPVALLKALDCYEYQSCEHEGWPASDAFAFCAALRHRLISLLPGYDDAEWEITPNKED